MGRATPSRKSHSLLLLAVLDITLFTTTYTLWSQKPSTPSLHSQASHYSFTTSLFDLFVRPSSSPPPTLSFSFSFD